MDNFNQERNTILCGRINGQKIVKFITHDPVGTLHKRVKEDALCRIDSSSIAGYESDIEQIRIKDFSGLKWFFGFGGEYEGRYPLG